MATLDVISLDDAKLAINVSDVDAHNDEIMAFITAMSLRMDQTIGPVVNRTVTEYHDGGCGVIFPRQTPVSTVTTLKEYDGSATTTLTAETFGTEPADGYLLEKSGSYAHDHRIVRRDGGSDYLFASGRRNVELVYVAGRAADTDSVDHRISQVAGMILRRLWRREAGSWTQSSDFFEATEPTLGVGFFKVMDSVVAEFLGDELKPPGLA